MPSSNSKKVVLITGCSSGFGMHIAARLSAGPYLVYATMRNLAKKDDLESEVQKRGGSANILRLDVTDKESIRLAVEAIRNANNRIDVLVNNAGYGIGGFFEDLTQEEIRHQMEVNFYGVQNVTREALPLMRENKSGKIINISSIAGINGSPCFGAYNASKWALEGFSESLYHELKFFGINVTLIEPGTYKTKIFNENARYAKNFSNPSSPYCRISQFLDKKIELYVEDCKKNPEDVAMLVEKIIKSKKTPFRIIPDYQTRIIYFLRRLLPFSIFSTIYRKMLFSGFKDPLKT